MEPEEALHFHILRRKKDGVEDWIDKSVEKIGAVPTLNDVLLPAMKEVGDKFGAGELILPFVLQSAEVMKKAVARLENYLDRIEGYTKGTVVIATVFGDVHDIGKSLVNTILTNNGYTVVDLGKQVPISTILDAAVEHRGRRDRPLARCSSRPPSRCRCACRSCTSAACTIPVLIGGAAINRDFGLRILYPNGSEDDDVYEPGVFYCKDAFEGLAKMDQLVDEEARAALVAKTREAAQTPAREARRRATTVPPITDASVRSRSAHRHPDAGAAVLGRARGRGAAGRGLPAPRHARAVQAPLGRARRQGRGLDEARARGLPAAPGAHVGEQDYLHPRAKLGYFPAASEGNEVVDLRPGGSPSRELDRLVFPRQPRHDRICLADFYRPLDIGEPRRRRPAGRHRRRRGHRADGAAGEDGEFAEQLFVHGLGVQTAEGMAEWLHAKVRARPRDRRSTRAAATRGATPPARTSPSTRRSSRCSTRRRSACACPAATPSSPSSRPSRSSRTTRRPSTSA